MSAQDQNIELFSDGEGLALIGSPAAVERFMTSSGIVPQGDADRDVGRALSVGSAAAQTASTVAESSGRWVKLTKESAEKVRAMGLTPTKTPGISHAMIGRPGASQSWIQVVQGPITSLTSPAALAGLGGVMSQMAMQHQLDVISDYLERIDEKLDGMIRTQMNQVLARVDAVGLAIAEAMTVREAVGRVSDVAWSKVQHQPTAILETQALAMRQLSDLAERFEQKSKVADLLEVSEEVQGEMAKWLSILARCFQLHEAHALLELDRVMGSSPEELDQHRLGLQAARRDRVALFERATQRVLDQLDAAASTANSKVLFNPKQSPVIVTARNTTARQVGAFHEALGVGDGVDDSEARRWRDAAGDQVDRARETGSQGVRGAKRLGKEAGRRATSLRDRLDDEITRRRKGSEVDEPPDAER